MDPYLFSLALGATGLVAMSLGGVLGHGGHAHGGHLHVGHGHGAHAHDARAGGSHAAHASASAAHPLSQIASWFVQLLSPRTLFSLLVGFGATGLLIRPVLPGPWTIAAAVAGGVAFELLLVRPLWNFVFRFASRPAQTLESLLFDEARAVTGFDASGHGLISITLDGEVRQLLGTLRTQDRSEGVRVRAGDRLLVEEVDLARNRCVVSRIGA